MAGFFDCMRAPPIAPGEPYPLFNRVSLETSSYCNRSCVFCPISTGRRPKQVLMAESIFDAAVAELSELQFSGVVQMFLLNEPTLDRRLPSFLRTIRTAVPSASTYVSTNGDVFRTEEDALELYEAGCTVLNINVYDSGEVQLQRLSVLRDRLLLAGVAPTHHKYRRHNPQKRYVALTDMRAERLDARAVDMFMHRTQEERTVSTSGCCARPHRHIVVMHDGRIPLCCAVDPTADQLVVLGQVPSCTLVSAWNSPLVHEYRWHLQRGLRDLPGCRGCDHRMAYSHVVRRVQGETDAS